MEFGNEEGRAKRAGVKSNVFRPYSLLFLCALPWPQNDNHEGTPKEALVRLIEKLKSTDHAVADAARSDLAALPKKDKEIAVPLLIKALKDTRDTRSHGQVRWCFDGMGQIAIPFLSEASTTDKDAIVREEATSTLGLLLWYLLGNKKATEEEAKPGISALIKMKATECALTPASISGV
jgi:hypothetical protein